MVAAASDLQRHRAMATGIGLGDAHSPHSEALILLHIFTAWHRAPLTSRLRTAGGASCRFGLRSRVVRAAAETSVV